MNLPIHEVQRCWRQAGNRFFGKVYLLGAGRHGVYQGVSVDFVAYFKGQAEKGSLF